MKRSWIIIIVALITLFILSALFRTPGSHGSTFSAKPEGVKAFYLLMERSGRVSKQEALPFTDLIKFKSPTTLFVITPSNAAAHDDLLAWVEKGNTVVYLLADKEDGLLQSAALKDAKLTTTIAKKRSLRDLFLPHIDETLPVYCDDEAGFEVCKGVTTITAPQQRLIVGGSGVKVHAGGMKDAAVISVRLGTGTLWIVADGTPIANQHIDKEDNLRFFYQLGMQGDALLFDEFHHGMRAPVPEHTKAAWRVLLFTLIASVILAVIVVISRSIRFGPAHEDRNLARAASADFARARGLLYEKYGMATPLVAYSTVVRHRLATLLTLSKYTGSEYLFDEVARRKLLPADVLAEFKKLYLSSATEKFNDKSPRERAVIVKVFERALALIKENLSAVPPQK